MTPTNTQDPQLLTQSIEGQINSMMNGMMPMLILSLGVSLLLVVVPLIISARRRSKEHKAILQTAQDIQAIREILENRAGRVVAQPQRSEELKNDPQLPPQSV